jgi:parvulin-like peptidyl-prolyl isomerase
MKTCVLCILATVIGAWAQAVPAPPAISAPAPGLPELPDETVVATFDDGTPFTMGEFRRIYAILPPQNQQMALRDRRTFLQQWAFMRKLSLMADQQKLEQESPTKEALAYYHMMIMSQAKINETVNSVSVEPAEIVKYYDVNKEKYKQVRVKAIYIAFSSSGAPGETGKKALTEDAAKAKASKLLSEIRGGADFLKAVKEHSDDETSRAKDGDFATLRPSDNIPDVIKNAVFALKTGEMSEPVKQPNGYYLFRAEEVSYRPLSQVRDEIFNFIKQQRYTEWLEKANKDAKVVYNSPAFLGEAPVKAPPAPVK